MQKTLKQYDNITSVCKSLFEKKLHDYGSAWRILRLSSLTDQIFIKAQRIRGLQKNSVQKVDEGESEEFIGIINYSVMALIQIEKGISEIPDLNANECIDLYDIMIKNFKEGVFNLMKNPENKREYAIDIYWKKLQMENFWYMITPPTVTQYTNYSDIEQRETNYDNLLLDMNKAWMFNFNEVISKKK